MMTEEEYLLFKLKNRLTAVLMLTEIVNYKPIVPGHNLSVSIVNNLSPTIYFRWNLGIHHYILSNSSIKEFYNMWRSHNFTWEKHLDTLTVSLSCFYTSPELKRRLLDETKYLIQEILKIDSTEYILDVTLDVLVDNVSVKKVTKMFTKDILTCKYNMPNRESPIFVSHRYDSSLDMHFNQFYREHYTK
jgi:hypothetical protein